MFIKRIKKLCIVLSMLLLTATMHAQYAVAGGKGIPLLIQDDSYRDLQIGIVYGLENVQISYTSTSTSHNWFRYKDRALEAEPVSAQQTGTTSVLSNIEAGYGYFVQEGGLSTRYVWIIDYSEYAFDIRSLRVSDGGDPCNNILLEGDADIRDIFYYTPNGVQSELKRTFEVVYRTMEWSAEDKYYTEIEKPIEVNGNPFNYTMLGAPLCDTEITLRGDSFARHFGVEKSFTTDLYSAIALEFHPDTTVTLINAPSGGGLGGAMSAPAEIQFRANANEPVASYFRWVIYRRDDSEQTPIVDIRSSEFTHTFIEEGSYIVELQIGDRRGLCSLEPYTFEINIGNFFMEVPNVFTPGTTPGVNDEFRVSFNSVVDFKGWIFNRWGNQLFHWTDPNAGWDGKVGGKYADPGVYFYIIEAKGSDGRVHKRKGSVNLLRSKTIRDEF